MSPLTLAELRLRHAQLEHRAEKLRAEWRVAIATTPRAAALGRAVREAQERADDYGKIIAFAQAE